MFDATRILSRSEIGRVLDDLRRKRRSVNTRQNDVIFRLSCCCGLRVSEIVGLNLSDVRVSNGRPHLHIRGETAKRGRSRNIPLNWDGATLAALEAWKRERIDQGAAGSDPFLCSLSKGTWGKRLHVRNAQHRWTTAIRCLCSCGQRDHARDCRVRGLSIHAGRHSFCSHALAGGRTLAAVRDAAGHRNVSTTSLYLHTVTDDDDTVGNLFEFSR